MSAALARYANAGQPVGHAGPAHTPRKMDAGPWLGYTIRRARKAGRCDYWLGERGRCTNRIEVGDEYVEGELSAGFKAGGFGRDRYCIACARGENEGAAS